MKIDLSPRIVRTTLISGSVWAQEGGEDDMFIDRAVYTRNRSFRLYLSSKAGKEAVLLPTGETPSASISAHNRRHVPRGD